MVLELRPNVSTLMRTIDYRNRYRSRNINIYCNRIRNYRNKNWKETEIEIKIKIKWKWNRNKKEIETETEINIYHCTSPYYCPTICRVYRKKRFLFHIFLRIREAGVSWNFALFFIGLQNLKKEKLFYSRNIICFLFQSRNSFGFRTELN